MVVDNQKIDSILKEKGISKSKLARTMDKANITITRKLNNENEWTFNELWTLTQILDVDLNDLLKNGGA